MVLELLTVYNKEKKGINKKNYHLNDIYVEI